MYKTIVVPLDGSDLAEQALPHAVAVARAFSAKLHLVRVFDVSGITAGATPLAGAGFGAGTVSADLYDEAARAEHDKAEGYLKEVAARVKADVEQVEYSVQQGPTTEILASLVEQLPADLVVMTSRGQGGLKRFVLGSVTDELVHRVETPVLVVANRED